MALLLIGLIVLSLVCAVDRQPGRRRAGRTLRSLGRLVARLNRAGPSLLEHLERVERDRPYVVVSNHQSIADIPLLSHLPVEAKWLAKAELLRVPVAGWMMRLAGDIPVQRASVMGRALALRRALGVLRQGSSVVIFPEGTRSRDGRLYRFSDGAFYLAVKTGTPILPVALEGCDQFLPRGGWTVGSVSRIRARALTPISTQGLTRSDVPWLREQARSAILGQLAEWRQAAPEQVDAHQRARLEVGQGRAEAAEMGFLPGFAEPLGGQV